MGKARHRGPPAAGPASGAANSGPYPRQKRAPPAGDGGSGGVVSLLVWLAAGVLLSVGGYLAYQGYMERRVNTPLAAPKAADPPAADDRYWGSYRPGAYFGLKARHPRSPVTGLMWFTPAMFQGGELPLRHWCEQGDGLDRYGWLQHDGRHFGVQELVDKHIRLETTFVKRPGGEHGGDWTARIKATPKTDELNGIQVSLLYYIALDDEAGPEDALATDAAGDTLRAVHGTSEALGPFTMSFHVSSGRLQRQFYLAARAPGLHQLRETAVRGFRLVQTADQRYIGLVGEMFGAGAERTPNFVVFQAVAAAPFELEVRFESGSASAERPAPLGGQLYDLLLAKHREEFARTFERKFSLAQKGYSAEELRFAQAALSNMVGGIGYFYGSSLVQSRYNAEPVPYWPASLYTAVPSRSFFPRGFLWDEGFHNLLLSQWDMEISRDIVAHWLDLMNTEGWIPREQILGSEARSKVPSEFVVQRNSNANPPTLLLSLNAMVRRMGSHPTETDKDYLRRLWPRLRTWYAWFNDTQTGELAGSYRWRGRDPRAVNELNPKTLTSGLDDFPRASHPNADERHVDLRCWMALASSLLADIGDVIDEPAQQYRRTFDFLADPARLDALHWSEQLGAFADFGLHTDSVRLVRPPAPAPDRPGQRPPPPPPGLVRRADQEPELRFVNALGYVGLFPLLLQLLPADSPRLGRLLDNMEDPRGLWTEFGLRSLAKTAPLYNRKNTEHDPPYWRGPIWININFLAVRALRYYGDTPGPHQERAKQVYDKLRHALVRNIVKEYKRTGYVWEQYNDKTGWGQGCRPFTGWSALVVLIMAETY
ncbi:mannosyl-oligosaccharide glucosidase-like isoform X1 [Amphibalanus amphitrite]|uniref:mannosyl-oligosaccharide glucosidase-like isoform X1 n=2 Tax=Amphibalanus amphitrite TaxID=1232801 RepID=UPI001C902F61|nr:mannosyl-oligosaccharide glucosidase-like isoform X1 [Amphibalanus amphitrite]